MDKRWSRTLLQLVLGVGRCATGRWGRRRWLAAALHHRHWPAETGGRRCRTFPPRVPGCREVVGAPCWCRAPRRSRNPPRGQPRQPEMRAAFGVEGRRSSSGGAASWWQPRAPALGPPRTVVPAAGHRLSSWDLLGCHGLIGVSTAVGLDGVGHVLWPRVGRGGGEGKHRPLWSHGPLRARAGQRRARVSLAQHSPRPPHRPPPTAHSPAAVAPPPAVTPVKRGR